MKSLFTRLRCGAILLGLLSLSIGGRAQSSNCFAVAIDQVAGQPGEVVTIGFRVLEDVSLVSCQFGVRWNSDQLSYQNLDLSNTALTSISSANFNFTSNQGVGTMIFAWFDNDAVGVPLQSGDLLFEVKFTIAPSATGQVPITFADDFFAPGVGSSEFYDDNYERLPTSLVNGGVVVGLVNPSPVIDGVCIVAANCTATYGAIHINVAGGTPPYSFAWESPGGPISGTEDLIGNGPGKYTVTVTDQLGVMVTGYFILTSEVKFLSIYPDQIQQPTCAFNDGRLEVLAFNGLPPYTFAWSNNVSGPMADSLSPGQYSVTATDAIGCTTAATFTLHETSGFSLDLAPQLPLCGQSNGTVEVTATGYSAPFQYLWNTGATTATITGLGPGVYSVTTTNAEGCTESKTVWLETQGANLAWVHNEGFNCDTLTGNVDLYSIFWTAPGIVTPINITWSNGLSQTIDSTDNTAFFFELDGQPQGAHYTQVSDAAGCQTFVFFQAECSGADPDPDPQSCLMLQTGLAYASGYRQCVAVTAKGFDEMTSLRFGLDWPEEKYLFTHLSNIKLTPFDPLALNVFEDQGALLINWQTPAGLGLTLPDGDTLFSVCFLEIAIPALGTGLSFSDDFTPEAVRAGGAQIGFAGFDGRFFGAYPMPDAACYVPADCQNSGLGGFYIDHPDWSPDNAVNLYQHGTLQWEGELSDLNVLLPGTYRADIFDPFFFNGPQKALLHIPQLITDDCVWPGDADNNAAANHHDLLYLGLAYGASGPARSAQSVDWSGQSGTAWSQRTDLRKVNYKNMDTDGDGLISAADTLAIVQNWGQVINPATDNPYDAPLGNQVLPIAPELTIAVDTATAGLAISLPILLGSAGTPVDSLHGLAFSLTYDPATLTGAVYFQPETSWLGDPATELLWLQRNFPEQGRLDVAITRFDGQPVSGEGVIGHLFVIIEDDIFLQSPGDDERPAATNESDTIKFTPLRFGNLQAVRPDEHPRALVSVDVLLPIRKPGVVSGTAAPADWTTGISVSPNPAGRVLHLASPEAALRAVELISPAGQVLQRFLLADVRQTSLSLPSAPAGMYWVKIQTAQGVAVKKVLISQ